MVSGETNRTPELERSGWFEGGSPRERRRRSCFRLPRDAKCVLVSSRPPSSCCSDHGWAARAEKRAGGGRCEALRGVAAWLLLPVPCHAGPGVVRCDVV